MKQAISYCYNVVPILMYEHETFQVLEEIQ